MRLRSLLGVGLVSLVFAVGCGTQSEDVAAGEGAVAANGPARTVEGAADPAAGEATVTIKMTLRGTSLETVRAQLADTQLTIWKGLVRPAQIEMSGQTIRVPGAGSPLFRDMTRSGRNVDAFMPFSEKGLTQYVGLEMKLSYELTDAPGSFSLAVTNRETIATRALPLDVVAPNKLSFDVKATAAGGNVDIEIHEKVALLTGKDKAGKMLGFAFAAADALAPLSSEPEDGKGGSSSSGGGGDKAPAPKGETPRS